MGVLVRKDVGRRLFAWRGRTPEEAQRTPRDQGPHRRDAGATFPHTPPPGGTRSNERAAKEHSKRLRRAPRETTAKPSRWNDSYPSGIRPINHARVRLRLTAPNLA